MTETEYQTRIPESFFKHRIEFSETWVDRWLLPNPFISPLISALSASGVRLTDFSLNKDAANLGETYLNVSIQKLNAVARIGLDAVTFIVANPNWETAPELVRVFDLIAEVVSGIVTARPASQKTVLAFHVTAGTTDFRASTARLVNVDMLTGFEFCGVSLHRADGALVIDQSLRYTNAAFIRIERLHSGDTVFSEVATKLYDDQSAALRLLGIEEICESRPIKCPMLCWSRVSIFPKPFCRRSAVCGRVLPSGHPQIASARCGRLTC